MYFIIFYNRLFSNTSFTEPLQKAEYKIYKISYCERGNTTENREHF
jgi:hypothetical protein